MDKTHIASKIYGLKNYMQRVFQATVFFQNSFSGYSFKTNHENKSRSDYTPL